MGKGPAKSRLVIAVFDGGDSLCRALSDLLQLGFTTRQIAVVGLAARLDLIRDGASYRALLQTEVPDILENVEQTALRIGRDTVVVTRNSLWQKIGSVVAANSEEFITAKWMDPQLRADLARHIREGDVVLGVSAETSEQQRQSTRALLKHSSARVQTHEFSRAI